MVPRDLWHCDYWAPGGRYIPSLHAMFDAEDWEPLAPARALLRNNQPLLAYIAGAPGRFTEKGHNFVPGARVEKQIVVINDSRETVVARCSWTVALPRPVRGSAEVVVDTGDQARLPILFTLPEDLRRRDNCGPRVKEHGFHVVFSQIGPVLGVQGKGGMRQS